MWFVSAYIRFSILHSIVESLVSGRQLQIAQNHISLFLQIVPLDDLLPGATLLPSLFCVSLIFGPNSLFGAEGTYNPLSAIDPRYRVTDLIL